MKRLLLTGILAIGGCFPYMLGNRNVETLSANSSNIYRQVINKDEKEGLKDLERIAKTGRKEEAFLFIPSKSQWIEIGFNETLTGCVNYRKDLTQKARENGRIIFYHVHPRSNQGKDDINSIFPSEQDFISLRNANKVIEELKIEGAVVSSYGVARFRIKELELGDGADYRVGIARTLIDSFAKEKLDYTFVIETNNREVVFQPFKK